MRAIDPDILAALAANTLRPFHLLSFDITDESFYGRYTDCDVSLALDGTLFKSRPFKISNIEFSSGNLVDQLEVEIVHLDKEQGQSEVSELTQVVAGGTFQDEYVTLYQVLLDMNNLLVGNTAYTLFAGYVSSWRLTEDKLFFTVVSILDRWTQQTLSQYLPSCRWKIFRGTECKYSEEGSWCDRTYTRCTTLGNTVNFGGFRWLPSIRNLSVWWGKERAEK